MSRNDRSAIIVWGMALALFLAGAALSVRTMRLLREGEAAFQQKSRELARLHELEAEIQKFEAARNLFEALPRRKPTALETLLKSEILPAPAAADLRTAREDIGEGWLVWDKEVAFHDAPLADVMKLAEHAENQRPPWRLVKCAVRASSRGPGIGNVTLTLRALEKKE